MTALTCIASNHPLPEVKNPHYKTLSVNEALSMGIDVPDFLLEPDDNRDDPDVILWADIEIVIDPDSGTVDDGGYLVSGQIRSAAIQARGPLKMAAYTKPQPSVQEKAGVFRGRKDRKICSE